MWSQCQRAMLASEEENTKTNQKAEEGSRKAIDHNARIQKGL